MTKLYRQTTDPVGRLDGGIDNVAHPSQVFASQAPAPINGDVDVRLILAGPPYDAD
jgi:hypothetical protein